MLSEVALALDRVLDGPEDQELAEAFVTLIKTWAKRLLVAETPEDVFRD